MPYKRNPMRAERACAIARHVIALSLDPAFTAATQWLERTLDDSANKRLSTPAAFLSCDAIALIFDELFRGIEVRTEAIAANLERELPILATENILMEAVRRGGDRQELHEALRRLAHEAARASETTALADRIAADKRFRLTRDEADAAAHRDLTGRSAEQVEIFLREELDPALAQVQAAQPEGLRV
jgi:adenylosuccinate lyase